MWDYAADSLAVWYAARVAEGKVPDPRRVERVREKLADVDAQLAVVERAGQVVGMALAEPFRDADGMGSELMKMLIAQGALAPAERVDAGGERAGAAAVRSGWLHPDLRGRSHAAR
jgi:hypothetical protein